MGPKAGAHAARIIRFKAALSSFIAVTAEGMAGRRQGYWIPVRTLWYCL